MAETFTFELRLVDQVTQSAKRAADSLRTVEDKAKKAQHALDFSKELERVEQQLHKLDKDPVGFKKLIAAQRELGEARKKLGKESFGEAFKEKLGFGRLVTANFLGDLLAEGLIEAMKKPLEFFAEGIKEAFKAGMQSEKLGLGARLSLGAEGGESFESDIERFYKKTGIGSESLKGMLLPLRNAGMSQESSRQALATAADIAAARGKGGDIGTIQDVLDHFQKIQQKGGVSEKMLIGLLGSAGGTSKEFFKSLGGQLNVTPEIAKKMAASGQVDPQLMMNTITQAVNKRQGGAAGTGGEAFTKTMAGRWEAITRLPEEYLAKMSKSPAWNALSEKIGNILEQFSPDSEKGKKVMEALTTGFTKVMNIISKMLDPKNIETFFNMLSKIPYVLDKMVTAAEVFAVIWTGSKLVGGITSIIEILPTLGTAMGGIAGPVAAMAGPLLAAAAAMTSVYIAVKRISSTAEELGGWNRVGKDFMAWASNEKPAIATGNTPSKNYVWDDSINGYRRVQNNVHAPVNVTVNGGDPEKVKQAIVDGHKQSINHMERAAQGG